MYITQYIISLAKFNQDIFMVKGINIDNWMSVLVLWCSCDTTPRSHWGGRVYVTYVTYPSRSQGVYATYPSWSQPVIEGGRAGTQGGRLKQRPEERCLLACSLACFLLRLSSFPIYPRTTTPGWCSLRWAGLATSITVKVPRRYVHRPIWGEQLLNWDSLLRWL